MAHTSESKRIHANTAVGISAKIPLALLIVTVLFQIAHAQTFKLTVRGGGEAFVRRQASEQKEQITGSAEIGFGDTLFTLAETDAAVLLETKSALLIKGGSVIVLNGAAVKDSGEFSIDVCLEEGQVFLYRKQPRESAPMRILTKGYSFTPAKTAAAVKTAPLVVPTVAVLRGSVQMLSPRGGSLSVEEKQFGTVNSVGMLVSGPLNEQGVQLLEAWSGVRTEGSKSENQNELISDDVRFTEASDTLITEPAEAEQTAEAKAPKRPRFNGSRRAVIMASALILMPALFWGVAVR